MWHTHFQSQRSSFLALLTIITAVFAFVSCNFDNSLSPAKAPKNSNSTKPHALRQRTGRRPESSGTPCSETKVCASTKKKKSDCDKRYLGTCLSPKKGVIFRSDIKGMDTLHGETPTNAEMEKSWCSIYEKKLENITVLKEKLPVLVNGKSETIDCSDGCLRIKYPKCKVKTKDSGATFEINLGGNFDELYLEYKVLFAHDFTFRNGGKLPGLGGMKAGSKEKDGKFLVRLMWRNQGNVEFYFHDSEWLVKDRVKLLDLYNYDKIYRHPWWHNLSGGKNDCKTYQNIFIPSGQIDQEAQVCEQFAGEDGDSIKKKGGPAPRMINTRCFRRGVWHRIKIHVVLNRPGTYEGIIEGWLDGEHAFVHSPEIVGIRGAGECDRHMSWVMFTSFFGGTDTSFQPPRDVVSYFKDVVVSTNDPSPQ